LGGGDKHHCRGGTAGETDGGIQERNPKAQGRNIGWCDAKSVRRFPIRTNQKKSALGTARAVGMGGRKLKEETKDKLQAAPKSHQRSRGFGKKNALREGEERGHYTWSGGGKKNEISFIMKGREGGGYAYATLIEGM